MHGDYLLVQRALEGDEAARCAIIALCRGPIQYVVNYVLGQKLPRDHVEDAIQEVWIALLEALVQYEGRASIRTFAARIARFQAFAYWRRLRPGREEPIDPQDPEMQSLLEGQDLPDPERVTEAREYFVRLEALLVPRLNPREHLVFASIFLDGLEPEQVAVLLNATVNNIYQMIFRIRRLARKIRDKLD